MTDKNILFDNKISSKAVKVYHIISTSDLKQDPSAHSLDSILKHCKEGRDSIRNAINELLQHKYIGRFQTREDNGFLSYTNYKILK